MTLASLLQIVAAILSPVVLATSCSIFLSALFNRYESMSARMRSLHRERLDLLDQCARDGGAGSSLARDTRRVEEIEHQLPGILARHRMVRNAILGVAGALLTVVVGMFLIAAAEITAAPAATVLALAAFLLAAALFLAGVSIATGELWRSHREISYEIEDGLRMR